MTAPVATVGESRTLLATMLGVPPESVRHYAVVALCDGGPMLNFCCDDRERVAAMLVKAALLVATERGESVNPGVPPPPMPCEPREGT